MCGICGIADFKSRAVSKTTLEAMNNTLLHRGPDAQGVHIEANVGLGHTRLSILDLSDAGKQPMFAADGKVVLVFNGEIYNYMELKAELEGLGVRFQGHSDSEVLLSSYVTWGIDCFARFNGIFAFALWDGRTEELLLVRDRFGIKPLYWQKKDGHLLFGSEIKAILAHGGIPRRINEAGLHEFMYYGNCLGNHTLFQGIDRLKPGSYMRFTRKGLEKIAYWEPDDEPPPIGDESEVVSEVRRRLERAVCGQLVSDVPVGIFLSGGIDSSCITAFASRHYEGKLQTFSVGFDFDKGVNELPKAKRVAKHYGTDHHELFIEGFRLPDVIESLVHCHDEPFSDAANIPLYLLCQNLGGSPKVILQGDGGDEIFAGYRRYLLLSMQRMLKMTTSIAAPFHYWFPRKGNYYRRARMLDIFSHADPAIKMALLLTQETLKESPLRVLSEQWRNRLAPHDPFAEYRKQCLRFEKLDPVQRMLFVDTQIILPNTFLEKVDKSTMAHSMEVRVPLLDNNLTDYVLRIPSKYKVRSGRKKYILREALRGVVPDEILDAPKTGFEVPYAYWLRGPLCEYMKSVLLDDSVRKYGLFDVVKLEYAIKEHIGGRRNFGYLLWKVLNLALWLRAYEPAA